MKAISIMTLFSFLCGQVNARGVLLKCWPKGEEQTRENILFQYDGGYIHPNHISYDGMNLDLQNRLYKIRGNCTQWNLPSSCVEYIFLPQGNEIEVNLEYSFNLNPDIEALEGHIYEVEVHEVFCKRTTL